ncbi:MAG: hypothetical protein A2231_09000 [Candidatus Firestonebacteria bacterium RIFOXYA2_FULL_40_8]|nr:MAG: hypothetical protein A2231_09000 [Candidatus Firestonebacteria bacterium RIFOXYA2_FULL_40_8]
MATEGLRFLDPKILGKIKTLELKAKYVVEGFMTGLHKSPYKGFSCEFAEYRQYMHGDDLRYIDWKVFGRTDKFYIKEFEEETNLRCYITLDVSESMGYKGKKSGISKMEYANYLVASLAYFMTEQRDGPGLVTLDNKIVNFIPSSMRAGHLHTILMMLEKGVLGTTSNLSVPLHHLAEIYSKRGLIILVTDLMDDEESIRSALKHMRFKGHEVILFHIMDYDELEFPFSGLSRFEEMETNKEMLTLPDALRTSYIKNVNNFITSWKAECQKLDIDYVLLNTAKPLDFALMSFLAKRSGLM